MFAARLCSLRSAIQLFKSLALWVLNSFEKGFSMAIFRQELPVFYCASVRRQKAVPFYNSNMMAVT